MLADQVAEFLTEKRRKKSSATYRQYSFILEGVFLPWCAKADLSEPHQVTDKQMDRFTDALMDPKRPKQLSIATVRTYVRGVRVFLTWADVSKGRYEQPRQPRRMREVLTRSEIDALEKAAREERDRLIVRVLADTGIRVSELLGLRGVDLRENTHERQTFIRVIGKGDKEREVSMPRDTFRRLKEFASHYSESEPIFQGKRRLPGKNAFGQLTPSGVDQLLRGLADRAKIKKRVYPHLFRHSYVTHLLMRNINPVVVQKSLGHTTLAMISETYSHLTAADSYALVTNALKE